MSIQVTGELSKQAPIAYVAMHIRYTILADAGVQDAVLAAVTDSQEKYCGVSYMLKKAIPVTWEIVFNGQMIFNNKPAVSAAI